MSSDCEQDERQHAAHQRRAWLLHRNLHGAEGVRHELAHRESVK